MFEFTVIIPVYKAEKFLKKCVDSVLNQTYPQWYQVILVDDGSPDRSGAMCDSYAMKDTRISVVHKENGGVARAREAGVEIAQGEYILFVDSDDWIREDMLQQLSDSICKHHPDIVCFGYYSASKDGEVEHPNRNYLGYYDREEIEKDIFPRLIQTEKGTYFPSSLCTKAIRRDILIKYYPKDCSIKIGEDWVTSIACVYHAKSIYMMDKCLYYYWHNDNSATRGGRVFDWNDPERQMNYLKQYIDLDKLDFVQQLERMMVHSLFNTAVSQFNSKNGYRTVARDIRSQLQRPIYASAISRSRFSSSKKAVIMDWCMKLKCIPVIALYGKMKNRRVQKV